MDRGRPDKLEFEDGGDERFEDPNGTPTRIAMRIPPAASFLPDRPLILGDLLASTSSIWARFHDLKGPFVAAASVLCCSTACLAMCCRSVRIRVDICTNDIYVCRTHGLIRFTMEPLFDGSTPRRRRFLLVEPFASVWHWARGIRKSFAARRFYL